jgi:preprotein translocase subunit SecG
MFAFMIVLHLAICLALVTVVLMQSGKGGGLAGGAFGGSAQTVFGGRGATDFLTRATMALGVAFFVTSLVLALMTSHGRRQTTRSLINEEARRATTTAPAELPPAPEGAEQQAPATPEPPGAPAGGQ